MKKLFVAAMAFFMAAIVSAQSAQKISEILETPQINFEQAAYLAQSASNSEISQESAFEAIKALPMFGEKFSATDAVRADKFALICGQTWNVKGSMFLNADKSGRYFFRQMKLDGVFDKSVYPQNKLSGREALNIITNCLDKYELNGGAQ